MKRLVSLAAAISLLAGAARAQAPAWNLATLGSSQQAGGTSVVQATALDASGSVIVAGYFRGTVAFGGTALTSAGFDDAFLAKYVPASGTWAWAVRAGGLDADQGRALAVSGSTIYLAGSLSNNQVNGFQVTFGSQSQNGATTATRSDLFVARYTDTGSTAALNWVAVGGGTGSDVATGVAVSGSSVYVAGILTNDRSNTTSAVFGNSGNAAGTAAQYGATGTTSTDAVLVKYTDQGSSATLGWTQVAGGYGADSGTGVAASGSSVYLTASIFNSRTDASAVRLGGSGTAVGTGLQYGAAATTSQDAVLARYTDNGTSASFNWSQVAGGTGADAATGVAVSGSAVYVIGTITNTYADASTVRLGGSGTVAGTVAQYGASVNNSADLLLTKYQDNGSTGSYVWSQVAGGGDTDQGSALAVSGSAVYVAGSVTNNTVNTNRVVFGGSGTTQGTSPLLGLSGSSTPELVAARYTDNGSTATFNWGQVAGAFGNDYGYGVTASASALYVGGSVGASYGGGPIFGTAPGSPLGGTLDTRAVLGQLRPATGEWLAVAPVTNGGESISRAVATDAAGNLLVVGDFTGQVAFGSTLLTSQGERDFFVAKYVPASSTWAWAQRGGGFGDDYGRGVAASGSSFYLTGSLRNNLANSLAVQLGTAGGGTVPVGGATTTASDDLLLAKYTDMGTGASLGWVQAAGGTGADVGNGVAVSGSSVYVAGTLVNSLANAQAAVFGGDGTTAGTRPQYGASSTSGQDLVLAKWTDNGATATFGWSQVAGGAYGYEEGTGVAATSSRVYLTGNIANSTADDSAVRFGGSGTAPGPVVVNGVAPSGSNDIVLARYTDQGSTAAVGWVQVAGGRRNDFGRAVAVSGSRVYVTGSITNDTADGQLVRFGSDGTTAGTSPQYGATPAESEDIVLAKYTDNGSSATFGWSQVGGGTQPDLSFCLAVGGANVYVGGIISNNSLNYSSVVFGGSGTVMGTSPQPGAANGYSYDLVVAKYTDNGSTGTFGWSQVGGGIGDNEGSYGLAVSGQSLYVVGVTMPLALFSNLTIPAPVLVPTNVLARLPDATLPLPTRAAGPSGPGLALYPNPSPGAATLAGAAPGQAVQVLDALGRVAATATADATGTARLAGLSPGLYLVRVGAATVRLAVK